jgi:hypothetical protein
VTQDISDRELELEKERTRQKRQETAKSRHEVYTVAAVAFAIAAAFLGLVGAITYGTTRPDGPDRDADYTQQRYLECMKAKGTWVPNFDTGLCIAEGSKVSS